MVVQIMLSKSALVLLASVILIPYSQACQFAFIKSLLHLEEDFDSAFPHGR